MGGKKYVSIIAMFRRKRASHSRVLAGSVVFLVIVRKKILSFLLNPPLIFW